MKLELDRGRARPPSEVVLVMIQDEVQVLRHSGHALECGTDATDHDMAYVRCGEHSQQALEISASRRHRGGV